MEPIFQLPKTVTVVKSGAKAGSVTVTGSIAAGTGASFSCGTTCSAGYPNNRSVMLAFTLPIDVKFGGWSGVNCINGPTVSGNVHGCLVSTVSNQTANLSFTALPLYKLTLSKAGGTATAIKKGFVCYRDDENTTPIYSCPVNTVSCPSAMPNLYEGTKVVCVPQLATGVVFSHWNGCGPTPPGAYADRCYVTMTSAKSVILYANVATGTPTPTPTATPTPSPTPTTAPTVTCSLSITGGAPPRVGSQFNIGITVNPSGLSGVNYAFSRTGYFTRPYSNVSYVAINGSAANPQLPAGAHTIQGSISYVEAVTAISRTVTCPPLSITVQAAPTPTPTPTSTGTPSASPTPTSGATSGFLNFFGK
jgi:hypothetical protein